jgi:hypothetical protein
VRTSYEDIVRALEGVIMILKLDPYGQASISAKRQVENMLWNIKNGERAACLAEGKEIPSWAREPGL